MERKYSKGKWEVFYNENGYATSIRSNHHICVMRTHDKQECNANAKLISAAPDMLDVLESIENDNNQIPEFMWIKIKDVIKKATE